MAVAVVLIVANSFMIAFQRLTITYCCSHKSIPVGIKTEFSKTTEVTISHMTNTSYLCPMALVYPITKDPIYQTDGIQHILESGADA